MAYEEYDGFGISRQQDIAELAKALSIGYTVDPASLTSGFAPLRAESIDNTLHIVTYQDRHIRFWKDVPKTKAASSVEQFIQLTSYGTGTEAFLPEGTAPEEDDASFNRKTVNIKYLGTLRKVTHPATLVQTYIMDAIAAQNLAGAAWIARTMEWALFWGDSSLAYSGESYEFDGMYNLIDNEFDMENEPLTEGTFNELSQQIMDNYGSPSDMYLPYQAYSDLSKQFFPKERVAIPTSPGYTVGTIIDSVITQAGPIRLNPAFFLGQSDRRCPLKTCPSSATSSSAPTAISGVAVGTGTGTTGEWTKSFPASSAVISYRVTAANRYGESLYVETTADTTFASSDFGYAYPLTITNHTAVVTAPEYFNIYRQDNGTGNYYWVKSVAATNQSSSATTEWSDYNQVMPNTYTAFFGEMSPDIVKFAQLSPLIKMDLATIEPSIRWMLLLYGALIMTAPLKWTIVRNIGRL